MGQPRNNHFIPVFYLKQWTNAASKLFQYSRPYKDKIVVKCVGPDATGFQRDLYSFSDCPSEIAHYLESVFLKQTDHLASLALAKLLAGSKEPWTPEMRSAWSRFILNFLIRHPDPYAEIKAVTRQGWPKPDALARKEYEQLRGPDDPATIEEWMRLPGNLMPDRLRIRLIQAAMDNHVVGTRLNSMIWDVIDLSSSGIPLLTSDWPLIMQIHGERMFFALPISPCALFTAATHTETYKKLKRLGPNRLAKQVNREVVSAARLYVFAADLSQEAFIRRNMSSAKKEPPFFPKLASAFTYK